MADSASGTAYQYVQVCADTSGTDCIYTPYHSSLPPLSIEDGSLILSAAVFALAVAWSVGVLYRLLFHKSR